MSSKRTIAEWAYIIFVIALFLGLILFATACAEDEDPPSEPPAPAVPQVRVPLWYGVTTPDGVDLWCFNVHVANGIGVHCEEAYPK